MSQGKIIRCGKYKLREEEFGRGGYGQVILAEKEEEKKGEKRLYVVKIPLPIRLNDSNWKKFDNDIEIINILSHIPDNKFTSIIYDFKKFEDDKQISTDTTNQRAYYVMDYFSKGLLFDYYI